MAVQPGPTVYVRNLEERVKIPELTETLREIFSDYGNVIDIVAKKNMRAKGQAFVVFDDIESATKAIEEIQGFELYDRPMVLDYARTRSDATVEAEEDQEDFDNHKKRRLAQKEKREAAAKTEQQRLKRAAPAAAPAEQKKLKPLKSTSTNVGVVPDEYLPPNKILFVHNYPDEFNNEERMTELFQSFPGFREVRVVPGRPAGAGMAFVEYETEAGAIVAKEKMAGQPLGADGKLLRVTFQRR